jgi:hypothetical protein
MTTEEQISKVREEREEASQELRETLTEIKAKAAVLEESFHPDHIVVNSPVAAVCVAGVMGFCFGSRAHSSILGPVTVVALLGYAISKKLPEHESGSVEK